MLFGLLLIIFSHTIAITINTPPKVDLNEMISPIRTIPVIYANIGSVVLISAALPLPICFTAIIKHKPATKVDSTPMYVATIHCSNPTGKSG